MRKVVLIGERDGEFGAWVAKPGIDVMDATSDEMQIGISTSVSQIIMKGAVTGMPATVTLGFGYVPIVWIVTSSVSLGLDRPCLVRPFPNLNLTSLNAQTEVASDGSDMVISGGLDTIYFSVLREAT